MADTMKGVGIMDILKSLPCPTAGTSDRLSNVPLISYPVRYISIIFCLLRISYIQRKISLMLNKFKSSNRY